MSSLWPVHLDAVFDTALFEPFFSFFFSPFVMDNKLMTIITVEFLMQMMIGKEKRRTILDFIEH
jgi:hypothetical protein